MFYFDESARLTDESKQNAKKFPQQVEMDIKVIDQFLDVAVHETIGAERLRGFIHAPVAFRNNCCALMSKQGSAQTNICTFINLSVQDFRSYAFFILF